MDKKSENWIFIVIMIIPIIWISLLIAPYLGNGLISNITELQKAIEKPFSITWCNNSIRSIVIFALI